MNTVLSADLTPTAIGAAVRVRPQHQRPGGDDSFTGTVLAISPASVVHETWYRIKRDVPTIVHGFVREEFWAHASEITLADAPPPLTEAEYRDFDERR